MKTKNRIIFWLVFIIVSTLCWIDYQYFTEGHAHLITPLQRQIGHIVVLSVIAPVGYIGWGYYGVKWIQKLWLVSHVATIGIIGAIGLVQWKTGVFGTTFLDQVSSLRLFFTSPLPYFMLYIIHKAVYTQQQHGNK